MKKLLALVLLAPCSCSSPRAHLQTGFIDPAFGLTRMARRTVNPLSALHTSVQVEGALLENEYVAVSVGAGPAVTTPVDGRSDLYGVEVSNRIQWRASDYIQPYLYQAHGIHYHDSYWSGSDVRYEFSTHFAIGVAIPVGDRAEVTVDYGWTHFSNGMTFHGDETRRLFGLPKASENWGFEAGVLSIGVSIALD